MEALRWLTQWIYANEVVAAMQDAGAMVTKVAKRFGVSRPAVRDWCDRAQRGELTPGVPGPKGPIKLTEADDALMREQVAARPGITARELVEMLSVPVTIATVCRRLIQLDLRFKKNVDGRRAALAGRGRASSQL